MSFFWMAASNAAVRSRIKWLGGGGESLAVVEESREVGGPSLLFRARVQVADVVDQCAADHTFLL